MLMKMKIDVSVLLIVIVMETMKNKVNICPNMIQNCLSDIENDFVCKNNRKWYAEVSCSDKKTFIQYHNFKTRIVWLYERRYIKEKLLSTVFTDNIWDPIMNHTNEEFHESTYEWNQKNPNRSRTLTLFTNEGIQAYILVSFLLWEPLK